MPNLLNPQKVPVFKFTGLRQTLIEGNISPKIKAYDNKSQEEVYRLQYESLDEVDENIFYSMESQKCHQDCSNGPDCIVNKLKSPYRINYGEFLNRSDFSFELLGKGGAGAVYGGEWCGQLAAFKYNVIKGLTHRKTTAETMKDINQQINELRQMNKAAGDLILGLVRCFKALRKPCVK